MKFICPLIVVDDMEVSRRFYETVLKQQVKYDLGENIEFAGGFSIHLKTHFAGLINISPNEIIRKANNCELYFEEDDIEGFAAGLKDVEYIHKLKEQPWGQRVLQFYDPDRHIIEVGESMASVVRRFLGQGLSVAETAKRTSMPEEFVKHIGGGIYESGDL